MQLFILDECPRQAARFLCDKHVVKMGIESVQMLSTVLINNNLPAPMKATHSRHPCTLWVGESWGNWHWTYIHAQEIFREYTRRYGKIHSTSLKLKCIPFAPDIFMRYSRTPFVDATGCDYVGSVVRRYRQYYMNEKRHFASWETNQPYWFK